MMTTTKQPLGIIISPDSSDTRFFHIRGNIIYWQDGKIRNPSDYDNINGFPLLNNLEINSQGDQEDRSRMYAWDVRYRNIFAVDVTMANKMVKTLTKLNRGLQRIDTKRGSPSSFGDYVGRVAEVIGATKILHRVPGQRTSSWPSYSEVQFTAMDIGNGVDYVNHMVQMWQRRQPEMA
jgi:hypothetical protein